MRFFCSTDPWDLIQIVKRQLQGCIPLSQCALTGGGDCNSAWGLALARPALQCAAGVWQQAAATDGDPAGASIG